MGIRVISKKSVSKAKSKFGRIGVLMGGFSTEREVSLRSGKSVLESLRQIGLGPIAIDIQTEDRKENINLIKSRNIDCAFLALHGRFGEDGQIQEVLENLGIPYTGSGVFASRLAMDKITSRNIFEVYGLPVPKYKVIDRFSYNSNWKLNNKLPLPWVVKPVTHGSSIGLAIVDKKEDFDRAVDLAFQFDERVLIEEFIEGREITVGILDDKALPVIEIVPKRRFFDYEAKYNPGMTEYIIPAVLEKKVLKKTEKLALSAHKLLGCVGCSRVDFILSKDSTPFILEVNTIPGFTQTSLLPKAASKVGIEFVQLCLDLIKMAYEKK